MFSELVLFFKPKYKTNCRPIYLMVLFFCARARVGNDTNQMGLGDHTIEGRGPVWALAKRNSSRRARFMQDRKSR